MKYLANPIYMMRDPVKAFFSFPSSSFVCRYEIIHQILFKKSALDIGSPLHIWQKSIDHSCVSLFLNILSHWSTCPSFSLILWCCDLWSFISDSVNLPTLLFRKATFCYSNFSHSIWKYRVILSIFTIIILLQRQEKIPEKRVYGQYNHTKSQDYSQCHYSAMVGEIL